MFLIPPKARFSATARRKSGGGGGNEHPSSFYLDPANIGVATDGGYFGGLLSFTADGVATHALIVAPRATGATGTSYTLTTDKQWKTTDTDTPGTSSTFDGASNTAAMVTAGIALHPAANFCVDLTIGGFNDWYLPAPLEYDIVYENLKPTTQSNNTNYGINDYSVPKRTTNRTAGTPTQTSVSAFQSGGAEAFVNGSHWSSYQTNAQWGESFHYNDGLREGGFTQKVFSTRVRAFRKIIL